MELNQLILRSRLTSHNTAQLDYDACGWEAAVILGTLYVITHIEAKIKGGLFW